MMCTDNSATGRSKDGGFAVAITQGPANSPSVIDTIKTKGRAFTGSLKKERAALEAALAWVKNTSNSIENTVLICTNIRSLCKAIFRKNPHVSYIQLLLNIIYTNFTIQWIPRYLKVSGNNLADKAAKEVAVSLSSVQLPIALSSALSVINDVIKDGPITHNRT